MKVSVKRIYEAPDAEDGYRLLVDRIWPRGVSKEKAQLDAWEKELAPTTELRKWFAHKVDRFSEFTEKYNTELDEKTELIDAILAKVKNQNLTLLYGAKDKQHNQAVVLKKYLEDRQ